LSSFLQTEDRTDSWDEEYYTYQRQPLHQAPTQINTPQLSLNLPQLTFEELKQKYSQFWAEESGYFTGGEDSAIATLDSFLSSRFHGYHWKLSRPWLAQKGATSHLSPHIAFGTISTRQIYQSTKARAAELANQPKAEFSLKAFRVSEA
jgi:deoxyribodipyrimidine photo-lyase